MEKLKGIFQDAQSSSVLNIDEEISAEKLLMYLKNYFQRISKTASYPLPSIEGIMETLACAAGLNSIFNKRTVVFAEDIAELISDKISYKEFYKNFMLNTTEITEIFTGIDQADSDKTKENLKEIITQYQ